MEKRATADVIMLSGNIWYAKTANGSVTTMVHIVLIATIVAMGYATVMRHILPVQATANLNATPVIC